MPAVIAEICRVYPVDDFFGNRWNTLDLCHCPNCRSQCRAATGREIPGDADPTHEEARLWRHWPQQGMLALMDLWKKVIARRRPGAFFTSGTARRGLVACDGCKIGERLPLVFCDRQGRPMENTLYTPGTQAWNSGRFAGEPRWKSPAPD